MDENKIPDAEVMETPVENTETPIETPVEEKAVAPTDEAPVELEEVEE